MNHSRKDVTMMCVIGALVLFAIFNFVFKPQRAELSSARSDLSGVEQNISDAEVQLQKPPDTVAPTAADDAVAPANIPQDPAVANLLRQLQAVADETKLTYASISPSPLAANANGPGGSLNIAIAASGPHTAVQAFLAGIRDLPRLAVIDQVSVSGDPSTADPLQTVDQLQMSVRVFTLQPPFVAPVAATPTTPSAAPPP